MDDNILDLDVAFADPDTKLYYIWKALCRIDQRISKLETAVNRLESAVNSFEVSGITITEAEHISYKYTKE